VAIVEFATTKRRLGVCKYRTKRIEIVEFHTLNNPPENVLDTLLHEIAHALAGPAARHGPVWKAFAVRIGATPRSCADSHKTTVMPGDWQANCPTRRAYFSRLLAITLSNHSHPLAAENDRPPSLRGELFAAADSRRKADATATRIRRPSDAQSTGVYGASRASLSHLLRGKELQGDFDEGLMATRCPNCDLVLRWRLLPGFSSTWRCPCGVTVGHTGSSFLEAWLRAVILFSVALGAAGVWVLKSRGVIAPTSFVQFALLVAGAAFALAAGLSTVVAPIAVLLAKRLGVPFSPAEKIGAAAATLVAVASCLVVALTWETFRSTIETWPAPGGNTQQAVVGNKK
jgi:hypothetical protein